MARRDRNSRRKPSDVSVDRVYRGEVYARVTTGGTGGERPFLLVPGIGVSANYFERLAPRLNEFGPVYALDLPGFGGVPHPKNSRMRIRDYADLVGQVIDELGLDDPVLLGHSMGTQIVSDLASRRHDISTVVLIGPVVNRHERTVLTAAKRFLQSSRHETVKVAVLAAGAYLLCGVRWFSRVLPEMMSYRIEEVAPSIEASTLVIRGEFDALCPRDWTEEITALIPRARAWEIPGAAHSVMHANAEEVARLCVDHARHPAHEGDDDELQTYPEESIEAEREAVEDTPADRDPAEIAKAVGGRVTEFVGIVTDDDDLIAQGKTAHAETMLDALPDGEAEAVASAPAPAPAPAGAGAGAASAAEAPAAKAE